MNKKIVIVLIVIIIFATVAFLAMQPQEQDPNDQNTVPPVSSNQEEKTVEVTDAEQIEKIVTDSYLNILLQIKTFNSLNISYEPLLEAAMRIARELDLYQTPEDGTYIEYVPRSTIHDLIYELSGIRINDPIIIEDFYYLYDENGDYYYIVPIGSDWLELAEVTSIHYTDDSDQYIIRCRAQNLSDYALETIYPNVEVRLKYKANNTYLKYQLVSINVGPSEVNVVEPDDPLEDPFALPEDQTGTGIPESQIDVPENPVDASVES